MEEVARFFKSSRNYPVTPIHEKMPLVASSSLFIFLFRELNESFYQEK